jgi:HD superfamily phosphodiesterase
MFVWKKSILFAEELNANSTLVQAAALTHDLNYAVKKNSTPKDGEKLRSQFLRDA